MNSSAGRDMVPVEVKPSWISEDNIEFIHKLCFNKIISFYVIYTPDAQKSARGRGIEEYHFNENELENLIKTDIRNWKSSGNGTVSRKKFIEADLENFPPEDCVTERVCFSFFQKRELSCFFGHVRNALAHGRFNIVGTEKNPVILMEDRNQRGNCSARMVLSLATLMKWIKEFEDRIDIK